MFLNFILIKISTCLGEIYCPSSGGSTLYTQHNTLCRASYVDCLLAGSGCSILTSLTNSQHNQYDKHLLLCIQCWDSWWWTVHLSQTCRVLYQNKVEKWCISLAFIIKIGHQCLFFLIEQSSPHANTFLFVLCAYLPLILTNFWIKRLAVVPVGAVYKDYS
jgi:hypothetical protein